MKKQLSKRRLKIKNKKEHEKILLNISKEYTINKKMFGDGYFMFKIDPHTVCWFFLDEFPDWKFAIWLNEKGYYIFGEAMIKIDKFKPSTTILSETDVQPFLIELKNILNDEGHWKEYNEDTVKEKEIAKKEEVILKETLERIYSFIREEEKKFESHEVDSYLEIRDRNSKNFVVSPRFKIIELTDKDDYFETEAAIERSGELFEKMSNLMPYLGNYLNGVMDYNREYISIDTFIFENREIKNPKDFLEEEIAYGRKEPITKFEDLVTKFKNEQRKN